MDPLELLELFAHLAGLQLEVLALLVRTALRLQIGPLLCRQLRIDLLCAAIQPQSLPSTKQLHLHFRTGVFQLHVQMLNVVLEQVALIAKLLELYGQLRLRAIRHRRSTAGFERLDDVFFALQNCARFIRY